MTTVTWVQDVNGNYEVSSPEHLIQIMTNGQQYTNAGDVPPSYWFNTGVFLQTVDIDLAGYQEYITPIGGTGTYQGSYDGGGYSVANWQFDSGTTRLTYFGMFSRIGNNGTVKHLRLTGVWKSTGDALFKGFLVGAVNGVNTVIDDIVTDFSPGTSFYGDVTSTLGVICGLMEYGTISGCIIRGSITFSGRADSLGGICGALDRQGSVTYCANYGNYGAGWGFGNTNTNAFSGGIVGRCYYGFKNMNNLVNGMTGDLYGGYVGGIIGIYRFASAVPVKADTWLNCMVGSIVSDRTNAYLGGVFGDIQENSGKIANLSNVVNIMSGNIQSGTATGGLVGRAHNNGSATFTISNSFVGMSGDVEHNVVDVLTKPTQATVAVNVDTSFGMTFTTDTYSTTDALTGYLTDSVFTICPYLDMNGTSEFGTPVEFDVTFSNLSGLDVASPYAQYTTLTIHTSPVISFPAKTEFSFADTNTTKYYTYSKRGLVNTDLYIDDTLTVVSTEADTLFNQTGTLISGLAWTQDGSGYYEISSAKHLIQLMTKGSVFVDTDSSPSDYRTGTYIQTADCDLQVYSPAIAPIGTTADPFIGDYIGGGFSISNWSYGEGIAGDGVGVKIGLFGEVQGNISNLKLGGKWDLKESDCEQSGFLVAQLASGSVYDIDADFGVGTSIKPNTGTTGKSTMGVLIGETYGNVTGIRLSGDITFPGRATTFGGVIGSTLSGASISWIQNSAIFNRTSEGFGRLNGANTSGNTLVAGGIVGLISQGTVSAFNLYNTMVGNIASSYVGGIVGRINTDTMTRSDTWVNCMQGTLTGSAGNTNANCSGGIVGDFLTTGTSTPVLTKMVNYMVGDISTLISGGMIGRTFDGSGGTAPDVQCNNSVIAMNGFAKDSVVGQVGNSVDMAVVVNEDFGLTFNTNTHATTDALTGYLKEAAFDLSYLSMTGGELGVSNDFEIFFVNLGGVAETSPLFERECLIIHTSPEITFPYKTVFDIPGGNTTPYLTYGRLSSPTLYIDSPTVNVVSTDALHILDYTGTVVFGTYPPIVVNIVKTENRARKQFHSLTRYSTTQSIATRPDSWGGSFTKCPQYFTSRSLSGGFPPFGIKVTNGKGGHYDPVTDALYYVNSSNGRLERASINNYVANDIISSDGTYFTMQGDPSNTYIFGSKTSSGGVQQIFRTGPDGTNEITVDTTTLFGGNDYQVSGFALNRDDEKVYFHDRTTYVVYSLNWDLTGLTTLQTTLDGDLTVRDQHSGSLAYAQGYLYFGGSDPQTKVADSKFYQYDLADGGTREMTGISDQMRNNGQGPTNDLYIDPEQNVMVISAYNTHCIEPVEFDFYKIYCRATTQYFDGWRITWDLVEGATSYQISVNDVIIGTTTDLFMDARGYADSVQLNFKILYSTDDITYTDAKYYYNSAVVKENFKSLVSPSNFFRINEGGGDWMDPYDPKIWVMPRGNNVYIYDPEADTRVDYYYVGINMVRRSYTTAKIIGLANNRLVDFGRELSVLIDGDTPKTIYTHPSQIQNFHCAFDGLIYFTVKTANEIWTVKENGTGAQLLFALNSTATSVATDPYHPNTLVYGDGNDLMYRDLSTGISRVVFAGAKMSLNTQITVLDDVIYTTYRWQVEGYLRVNIDGVTDLDQGLRSWGFGTLVDTVNQKVFSLAIGNYTVNVDGNFTIASLPPDPSKMTVRVNPFGLVVSWMPISGVTEYRVSTSSGVDGVNDQVVRYTTSDVDRLKYRHPAGSGSTLTVYLHYDTATETNVEEGVRTVTIPGISTSVEDFDKTFFETYDNDGVYDLSNVVGDFSTVMNELFVSGDRVELVVGGGKKVKTQFVRRGGTVTLTEDEAVSVPFSQSGGAGQSVSLTLSDSSTVAVEYNETTEQITVSGTQYNSGDSFVIDGKKVTIVDI